MSRRPSDRSDLPSPSSRSEITRANLESSWNTFERLCTDLGKSPLPASLDTLIEVLDFAVRRTRPAAVATLLQAVHERHLEAGCPSPVEDPIVQHVARAHRTGVFNASDLPSRKASPVWPDELLRMLEVLPDDTLGKRNRALLLLARAARLSSPQVVNLRVSDVDLRPDGRTLVHTGRGKKRWAVEVLPVEDGPDVAGAVTAWLEASGIKGGLLFRPVHKTGVVGKGPMSPRAVGLMLQRTAELAGLPPAAGSTELFRRP